MSTSTIIILVVLIAFFVFKQMSQVSVTEAQDLMKQEHLLIDVRTESEFSGMHVQNAINIPLDRLSNDASKVIGENKEKIVLLYCLSGSRSSFAKKILEGKGYNKVYNLGSLSRAKAIVEIP